MRDENRKTWIVVADGGHARILLNTHRDEGVTELPLVSKHEPRLAHHQKDGEAGIHHSPVFKPTEEHRNESRFVDILAATLETGIARKECDQLALVAPAATMGHLRNALGKNAHKHIVAEIVHDYTHQNNQFIYQHVKDKLPL
jgi:protein required for attachment to host cells